MAKSFNGADFDDSVLALLDPEIVKHWKALPHIRWLWAHPPKSRSSTMAMPCFDGIPEFNLTTTIMCPACSSIPSEVRPALDT